MNARISKKVLDFIEVEHIKKMTWTLHAIKNLDYCDHCKKFITQRVYSFTDQFRRESRGTYCSYSCMDCEGDDYYDYYDYDEYYEDF